MADDWRFRIDNRFGKEEAVWPRETSFAKVADSRYAAACWQVAGALGVEIAGWKSRKQRGQAVKEASWLARSKRAGLAWRAQCGLGCSRDPGK